MVLLQMVLVQIYFNPRSHERSDDNKVIYPDDTGNFNPRSHERSDDNNDVSSLKPINFNPRSHERSDCKRLWQNTPKGEIFQSTLPREERHFPPCASLSVPAISIHAPTRGATAILHKKFVYFYTIPTINI